MVWPASMTNKITKIKPYLSKLKYFSRMPLGKNVANTFEPSRGGIGTKLKIIKTKLIYTIKLTKPVKVKLAIGKNLKNKPKNKAIIKFPKGPAIATLASPYFLSLKLFGLYGTGLAQPKRKGLPVKTKTSGRKKDPNHSR